MRHIVTLTAIPPRFDRLGPALRALVAQNSRPEAVELYIPRHYRRFPQWGGGLPEVPEGVRIVRVDEDLGPATKVLPAARAWRGTGVEIYYGDDDRIVPPDFVAGFLKARRARPDAVICGAGFGVDERYGYPAFAGPEPRAVPTAGPQVQLAHKLWTLALAVQSRWLGRPRLQAPWRRFVRSGHVDIAEGYGGVLIRPEFLDDAAFAIPPVVWAVDDIWLSGCYARQGVPIWGDRDLFGMYLELDVSLTFPLYKAVIEGADRHAANRACIDHMRATYGIWGGVAVHST